MTIRPYSDASDRAAVIALWTEVFGVRTGHNDPAFSIDAKLRLNDDLFLVAAAPGVVGTVMAGYDGHRGWIYSVAVTESHRRRGIGSELVRAAEIALRALGCGKINLQITDTNASVVGFYEKLGFSVEPRISMGKKLFL